MSVPLTIVFPDSEKGLRNLRPMEEDEKGKYIILNPIEEAEHFKMCQVEMGMTVRDIESKYGISRQQVSVKNSLLSLPITLQDFLSRCRDNFLENHGYEISKLLKPGELRKHFEDNKGSGKS